MKEELLKGLTKEQIAKIVACKNQEELLKVAKEEGIELNDDQLEAVSGGCGTGGQTMECPKCHAQAKTGVAENGITVMICPNCGMSVI